MSTNLPMLMPAQATGGGEATSLPVNTEVGDSSQAFANILGSHIQPDGTAVDEGFMPLQALDNSALTPLLTLDPSAITPLQAIDNLASLPISAVDKQILPLDLSQAATQDGNALPLSPELMWSGMLIANDSGATGPQLYQLSEDGQSLTSQIDPNMRAQVLRAMNQSVPMTDIDMPEMVNITGQTAESQMPGMKEQSILFTAMATSPVVNKMAAQKAAELLPALLLNTSNNDLASLSGGETNSQGLQALNLATASETASGRFPELAHLQMSGSPKSAAWAQGLGERVQWLVQQNIQGAEIRLNPPELGALEIKLQLNGDQGTQIQFTSPNGTVREALESAIPRLREMFAESGLNLGDVNVSHQSLAEQQQNGGNGEEGDRRDSSGLGSSEQGISDDSSTQKTLISEGLVDMYV